MDAAAALEDGPRVDQHDLASGVRAAGAAGYRWADGTIQWVREGTGAKIYDREFDAEQFGKEIAARGKAA